MALAEVTTTVGTKVIIAKAAIWPFGEIILHYLVDLKIEYLPNWITDCQIRLKIWLNTN